ncbi:hypothetical protein C5C45_15990 [Rathayibacter rathayi]|nr:hypothetical protein C5C08_16035 [Rathayibacter rathayi]PPG35459.1 hypothetical protein C5C20_16040 [Rathayibacter rathayi]PPG73384.1 hypothetical protein C5C15_15785 [Rathayibacter rathayi]PPH61116.1 hypothetical protein C5C45_15990 [Rathayibacter rathayi]TWD69847.1 hypothetical protein FB469_1606 [Rathayibacter rathayi]
MLPNETRFGRLSEIQDEIMGFTMEQVGDKEAYAKLVFCRVKKMSPWTALKASRKVRSGRR